MSNTPNNTPQGHKIRIVQHNVARSTNVMQTCLENSINNADIVLMQEPWMSNDHVTTISHPAFNCIIPANTGVQPRVMAFVTKRNTVDMTVTPRPDICQDSDIQVLDISTNDLPNLLIFNVYNEKQIGSEDHEHTVERKLSTVELSARAIICGDFNAHHSWWNSRVNNPVRADALVQ